MMNSLYIIAEYIWIDANKKFRSKTKIIRPSPHDIQNKNYSHFSAYPKWDYDGSSTGQADGKKSEITLVPVFVCDNPLLHVSSIGEHTYSSNLVLCETYNQDGKPTSTNRRYSAEPLFEIYKEEKPWFGLEQEYFILDKRIETTPHHLLFYETTEHYCGIGRDIEYRKIAEEHMTACIKAGITISGINAEVSKNQWEFQIGPSEGILAADELMIARFLLERIAEKYETTISYEPNPFTHINGSGCHTNFSTLKMRTPSKDNTGLKEIRRVIDVLEKSHAEDIKHYGVSNELRLSGNHETSSYDTFTWGVGDRGVSVRINNGTHNAGYGYFEDRRPAANMDPYLVTAMLMMRSIDMDF